jgi:uncharacterized membrane protein YgdD (TMEM256/DUF423 family)
LALWLFLGALNGLAAVAAGAYGWHALAGDEGARKMFEIGVQYQMGHALALVAVAWLATRLEGRRRIPVHVAGAGFTLGVILFSGTLYAFGLTGVVPVEGAAPAGGFLLMIGWLAVMWIAAGSWLGGGRAP